MKEKLKKLRDELLYVPKRAKISESKMTSCLISCVASIVICLICLGATSWAWFRGSVSTGITEIRSGEFRVNATFAQTAKGRNFESATKEKLSASVSYTLFDGSEVELDLSGVEPPAAVTGFAMDPLADTDPDMVNMAFSSPLIDRTERDYTENRSKSIPLDSGRYVLTLEIVKNTACGYVDVVYGPENEEETVQRQRILSSWFVNGQFTVSVDAGEEGGALYIGASWSDQLQILGFLGISEPESTIGDTDEVEALPTSEELQKNYDDAYARYEVEYNLALAKAKMDAAGTLWDTLKAAVPDLEALQTTYDKAKEAYEAAQTASNDAKKAYDAAQTAYNNAKTAYDEAQTAYDEAQKAYEAAQAPSEAAQQSSEEATKSEATKSEAAESGNEEPESTGEDAPNPEQALADAKAAYEKAKATYEEAEAACEKAKAAYEQAEATRVEAEAAYAEAKVALDEGEAAAQTADDARVAYEAAEAAYKEAETAYNKAVEKYGAPADAEHKPTEPEATDPEATEPGDAEAADNKAAEDNGASSAEEEVLP